MNVSDIIIRVKRLFGDESGVQITDDDIIRWINEAQRDVVRHNGDLLQVKVTTDLVADQQEYSLPDDLLILQWVSFKPVGDTRYYRMKYYSPAEINEYIDGWDSETERGTPKAFSIFAGNIIIWPVSNDSSTDALKIYYNRTPNDISTGGDELDLPLVYHETLVNKVLQKAYELDENFEAAQYKNQETQQDLNIVRGREQWKQQETYERITVLDDDLW